MEKIDKTILQPMVIPLLHWYSANARDLPWRRDKNPYHIWISEVILQQTRVENGKKYYERFIKELPTISALAQIDEQKLMKLWEGLGYYSRARNLKKAATIIMEDHQGIVPDTYEILCTLPGIGPYTAGAISSIAYDELVSAVDGNVLRVMARYLALKENISKASVKKMIAESLTLVLPRGQSGDFNQALMELGALICLPNGKPKCEDCPLMQNCRAYQQNVTINYPIKDNKKERRIADKVVFIVNFEDKIALVKRPNHGLLAGLWGVPILDGKIMEEDIYKLWNQWDYAKIKVIKKIKSKHIFTHVEWHMTGYLIQIDKLINQNEWIYVKHQDITQSYAIPSAFKPFIDEV